MSYNQRSERNVLSVHYKRVNSSKPTKETKAAHIERAVTHAVAHVRRSTYLSTYVEIYSGNGRLFATVLRDGKTISITYR